MKKGTEVRKCERQPTCSYGNGCQLLCIDSRLCATFFTWTISLDLSITQQFQTRSSDSGAQDRGNYTLLVLKVTKDHRSQAKECGFDFVGNDQSCQED